VLEELSSVSERPMIIRMTTTLRPQQRYDHRLRALVHRTGDVTIATDLGVPRSTARGWLGAAPPVVVSLDVAALTEPELRQEVLKLRRRVQKALLHESQLARTMPTDRALTCRCDTTRAGRGRSSDSGSRNRGRPHSPARLGSGLEGRPR
jgi:hypothetical protein